MKGKTMLKKKATAIAAVASITAVAFALGISPAKAFDPVAQRFAIVGSDTLEDVVGALVNGTDITGSGVWLTTKDSSTFGSFDATGTGTIITKKYGTRFQRPNGSGDGRTALQAQITGDTFTSGYSGADAKYAGKTLKTGDIDIVRASSGGTQSGDGTDLLQRYTFGRDAIALAYASKATGGITWPGTAGYIPAADLKLLYQCDSATLSLYNISKVWIPQAGSGTRNDFESKAGLSDSQDILANLDTNTPAGCIHVGQEHDASLLGGRTSSNTAITANEIMPMSATRWIAMKNGASYDKSGADATAGTVSLGGFVASTSPTTTVGTDLAPSVDYYKDSTWGRDTYLMVDRRRTDNSTATATVTNLLANGTAAATPFIVSNTSGIYAGQAVSATAGLASGTKVKQVSAGGTKTGTGDSAATFFYASSAPAANQLITSSKFTPNTVKVTTVTSSSSQTGTTSGSQTSGTSTLVLTDGTKATVGSQVQATGIPVNTYVTAVSGNSVSISKATVAAIGDAKSISFVDANRVTSAVSGATDSATVEGDYTGQTPHIVVGAAVTGTNVDSNVTVKSISGTTVTFSKPLAASGKTVAANATLTFTKIKVEINGALNAAITYADSLTAEKTLLLTTATTADIAAGATLTFTSPSYDPVLARALDYSYSGSLTYQGGPVFGTSAAIPALATTGTASASSTALTLASGKGAYVEAGETVLGTGIADGTTIASVSGDVVTLSAATTLAVSGNIQIGYTYAQMNSTNHYPYFPASSVAAVKLKFGFLPSSSQPTNEYTHK